MLSEQVCKISAQSQVRSRSVTFADSKDTDLPSGRIRGKAKAYDRRQVKKSKETRPDKRGFEETMKRAKDEERCGEQVGGVPRLDGNPRRPTNAYPKNADEDEQPDQQGFPQRRESLRKRECGRRHGFSGWAKTVAAARLNY